MGVLKNLTDEYFGNKVRKEDMKFRYDIDEKCPPKHTLTADEEAFLQGLARYKLYLDKSLFFQIEDLQQHTELVLSGKRRVHLVFPNHVELRREIAELDGMIKNLEEKLERKELPEDYYGLLGIWKEQRAELDKALDSTNSMPYLGLYFNNGVDSKVTLFVDAIEEQAKQINCETKFLMGQVLLHEYFHSFHFHVGVALRYPMKCIEEPMAEYGSLMVLDSVASSGLSIAKEAGDALTHTLGFVKSKQACTGFTAAYRFGSYLFEKHKADYYNLIALYANKSCMMDNRCKEALEYKYLLYPKYPSYSWAEDAAFKRFEKLLKNVVVREPNGIGFVRKVFEFLRDNDMLDSLAPFIHAQDTKNPRGIYSISKDGYFCLRSILMDDPTTLFFVPFIIEGHTYYLRLFTFAVRNDTFKSSQRPRPIDEFIKMIEYVYRGQFAIRDTGDEYIMSYEI